VHIHINIEVSRCFLQALTTTTTARINKLSDQLSKVVKKLLNKGKGKENVEVSLR